VHFKDPGKRRFDVLLEGKKVLEDYEPKVNKAETFTFEQAVQDGHLEILFIPGLENPKISAIAIEVLR
jgi:hypothetical protein